MSLRSFSVLAVVLLGAGFVSLPLPVRSLPVDAIEIAQSSTTPSNAEDFYNRGVEKGEKGDFQGAIADYNQALRINPNYAKAYLNRGDAYHELGEYQKAIADYNQALRINPDYIKAYIDRGHAYSELKEYEKAMTD